MNEAEALNPDDTLLPGDSTLCARSATTNPDTAIRPLCHDLGKGLPDSHFLITCSPEPGGPASLIAAFSFSACKLSLSLVCRCRAWGTSPFRGTEHPHRSLRLGGMREMLTCTVAFTFTISFQETEILDLKKDVRLGKLKQPIPRKQKTPDSALYT